MKVGLQVYTVRNHLKENPEETLRKVAEAGYKGIEFANHTADQDVGIGFGYSVEKMKNIVRDLGITVLGGHVCSGSPAVDIYTDLAHFQRIIEYYAELGAQYLVIPCDYFPTLEILKKRCEDYNRLGELCKRSGLCLLYHNHWNEYQQFDGKNIIDLLMEGTDPGLLKLELDAYWTVVGLINPVTLLHKYGNRVALIHQKDFPLEQIDKFNIWNTVDRTQIVNIVDRKPDPELFTEIGEGILKIQDMIDAGNAYGVPYILVEQDHSKLDELESIRVSMDNFKKMRGLSWD